MQTAKARIAAHNRYLRHPYKDWSEEEKEKHRIADRECWARRKDKANTQRREKAFKDSVAKNFGAGI